jgi:hypothetical protein
MIANPEGNPMQAAPPMTARDILTRGLTLAQEGTAFAIYTADVPKIRAMGFRGKSCKPVFNWSFRSQEHRDQFVGDWTRKTMAATLRKLDAQAQRRAAAAAFDASKVYKAGDVLVYSWGYDQTNVDLLVVVSIKSRCSLEVAPIAGKLTESTGHMAGYITPQPDQLTGPARVARVGEHGIKANHGHFAKWSGRPVYCSWYA